MASGVLLNNVDHRDLRVITARAAAYGDDVMLALTFPAEFRNIQAHYPIVFRKATDNGQFQPVALFGFEPRQNLFLGPQGWDASYVPLLIERQPFLIGHSGQQMMMHIDLASPRVSRSEGEALFRDHGGTTDYLERMNSALLAIHQGLEGTPAFVETLLAENLLESFVIDIQLRDGSQNRLAGYYTIHEERLASLAGHALERLQGAGHLQPIYMAIASLSQFRTLIERRNRLNAGGS